MIAMAIMVVALSAILSVESESIRASARATKMNVVAMLAKDEMVEYENKFQGKTFEEFKKEDGGTFKPPFEAYRWQATVKEIKLPSVNFAQALAAMGGAGSDSSGGSTSDSNGAPSSSATDLAEKLTKLVTNFLSKSIREVTVTVIWKHGTKDQKFSLTTYWVDLNHEFDLSETN